jgi:hypothetical protein
MTCLKMGSVGLRHALGFGHRVVSPASGTKSGIAHSKGPVLQGFCSAIATRVFWIGLLAVRSHEPGNIGFETLELPFALGVLPRL